MKTEADILTVTDGQIKEIKLFGEIYEIAKKKQEMELTTKKVIYEPKKVSKDFKVKPTVLRKEGKQVNTYGGSGIHKNLLEDVKQWFNMGLDRRQIGTKIYTFYKPHIKKESCNALASVYMRYVQGLKPGKKKGVEKGKIVGKMYGNSIHSQPLEAIKEGISKGKSWKYLRDNVTRKYFPNYKETSLGSITTAYKLYVEGHRGKKVIQKKRKGFVGKSDKYNVWIKQDDINEVKRGINTYGWGYKPTFDQLRDKTNLPFNRLRGTLDVMISKGLIDRKIEKGDIVYRMKD